MSGPKQPSKRRRRERLFAEQDGRCYWCGDPMNLVHFDGSEHPGPDDATLEHLYSWMHKERRTKRADGKVVLAHQRCNQEYSRECERRGWRNTIRPAEFKMLMNRRMHSGAT